jgi:hypothetical protein
MGIKSNIQWIVFLKSNKHENNSMPVVNVIHKSDLRVMLLQGTPREVLPRSDENGVMESVVKGKCSVYKISAGLCVLSIKSQLDCVFCL